MLSLLFEIKPGALQTYYALSHKKTQAHEAKNPPAS